MLLYLVFYLGIQNALSRERAKREIAAGPSDYSSPDLSGPFVMEDGDSGYCLQAEGTAVRATTCTPSRKTQQWLYHNTNLLRNEGTKTCLKALSSGVSMASCGTSSSLKWGCNTKSSGRPGLKSVGEDKCLRVKEDQAIDLQTCDHKAGGQLIRLFGQPNQFVCTRQTDVGTRTKDPNYYLLKHQMFHLGWNEKYVKVFLVYNKDLYARFLKRYKNTNAAMQAIREHAMETIAILDKAYRQIKVRMLLVGYEVWPSQDKIPDTIQYYTLKSKFREYSYHTLRKIHHFDTSVFLYGKSWDGAWSGAGMSDMCKAFNGNPNDEVFVMAMHHGTSAHSLAHLLSHEFGHQFNMGHPMEPGNPCPPYRLYGTRCTMGGNSWPKGFSARFLYSIRRYKYSCLDTKPSQDKIILCGNGKLDPMEECDCGSSQACKTSNPCCDGSICKLRKGAECSSEACCTQCKYDTSKKGCKGNTKELTGPKGIIESPYHGRSFHQHWLIKAPMRKVVKITFALYNFEFQEGCPFDYIEVRDGSTPQSKLIGKYCRIPSKPIIKSTSNSMFITYHADRTFQGSFKIHYSVLDKRQDLGKFFIKHYGGLCVSYSKEKSRFLLTKSCSDLFKFEKDGFLKHISTNKCVRPSWHGNGAPIVLTAACHSTDTLWTFNGDFSIQHGLTGRCIHPRLASNYPPVNGEIVLWVGCTHTRLQFKPNTVGGHKKEYFRIKHRSGKCVKLNDAKKTFVLSSSCADLFSFTSTGRLLHRRSNDCVMPRGHANADTIMITQDCDTAEAVFTFTSKGSLYHKTSKKCIHPKSGGWGTPPEGDNLVIYSGCDQDRLRFEKVPELNPDDFFTLQHHYGKCVHYDVNRKIFALSSKCTDLFTFTSSGNLLHIQSKQCVKPKGHANGDTVSVSPDCNTDESVFSQTGKKSLKHKPTGKCIHPRSGGFYSTPEGDALVLYSGCDQNRLQFNQVKPNKPA